MTRSQPTHPSKRRRRIAATVIAGTIAAGGIAVATPSAASASGLSTTISRWSSSDFTLGDASNTKVTLAAGIDEVGVIGRSLTATKTVSVKIDQSKCTTGPAGDVLVTRTLSAETPVGGGVTVNPLFGSASIDATVPVSGTETKTPAGTGGDCNEPNQAGATTSPITDSVKVNATWSNKRGSTPLYYGDIYQQGVFYYRDATASGSIRSASTGQANLRNSSGGWLWSGAWVYATGT